MLLRELVQVSKLVSEVSSRLQKLEALSSCLRKLDPHEVAIGVSFLSGELRQGRIGVGYATLGALRELQVAETDSSLTLADVDSTFQQIVQTSGRGSAARREALLSQLFAQVSPFERDFLMRLIIGELRQGALEGLMVDAVARAAQVPLEAVRRAAMLSGSLVQVAEAALAEGASALARFSLEILRPISPMLAQTAENSKDAIGRLTRVAIEDKLDGARIQVHRKADEVRVFSRQLNDVTDSVPEIVESVKALPVREIVLDGEAIAFTETGRPQPFQVTMRRFGRKLDVEKLRRELPLTSFFFDCLALDGQTLIDHKNSERVAALEQVVPAAFRTRRCVVDSEETAERFIQQALEQGHEGVVFKSLDAAYEAGRRGASWLKLKPVTTLDLVILAVEWGSGRRSGWLSNLHLGARDEKNGGFAMLGKTFKGMTDEMLAWQTEHLSKLEVRREGHIVFVRPELVVEIAFDGVQASPHYPSGLALRFARVKSYRHDKAAAEADTLESVQQIFVRQHGATKSAAD